MEFLFLRDVEDLTGLSETTISRLERRKGFPPRIRISRRRVAWLKQEVLEWMNSIAADRGFSPPPQVEAPCDKK
jgi:predicted DNA-binding transcriptional regulator AlpA